MIIDNFQWWSNLFHGGMLLDAERLSNLIPSLPPLLNEYQQDHFHRELIAFCEEPEKRRGPFAAYVLQKICDYNQSEGDWFRGSSVSSDWTCRGLAGEAIRPTHLWIGSKGALLPVFIDDQKRLGIGRGRRVYSQVLQWLRQINQHLAIITNGFQWRLVFAGLDYEAYCQWDIDQWFAEGQTSLEFSGFRALLSPSLWIPPEEGQETPLLAAINESRKGQADLSQILGERVRQAGELLIDAHTPVLNQNSFELDNRDIYHAAVRMIMRLVVILFAESREGLLPRDNPIFNSAYSLQGLREILERTAPHKLRHSYGAYPRFLALLQLIYQGSSHEAMPVTSYGGELFEPGQPDSKDGMKRALNLFETACFNADLMNDYEMRQILNLLTRTRIKIRQGRSASWIMAPVDFSSLGSEYLGILYEGLLDFELRCATEDEPIVFLSVGNQPALPLSNLEQMDDNAIKDLLEKLKDISSGEDEEELAETGDEEVQKTESFAEEFREEEFEENKTPEEQAYHDRRYTLQSRAEKWARSACEVGGLVKKPRGKMTPEKKMQYDRRLDEKARQLVIKVVLPGEWYLVRWGGTRKGAGTFYTRPQLAIPTAYRTLRPLAYMLPEGDDNSANMSSKSWIPKKPEEILDLKVCDPACGSGSFCIAALRFLTNALYESLVAHDRIHQHAGRAVLDLIYNEKGNEALINESLPCPPEDDEFELRTKAILRRYIVERCIYGVDIDPLAVELCRLSLWIETLDRNLPLTFLNHKIKVGNSLVGTWFDQFLHYPVMAWEREGGDKNHTNGVHYPKDQWTKRIKKIKGSVKENIIRFIDQYYYIDKGKIVCPMDPATVRKSHSAVEKALEEIHGLGISQIEERAVKYNALRVSPEFQKLKEAFDLWCALWFWPPDQLDKAPLPFQFASGDLSDEAWQVVKTLAHQQKFFHWELEFPDVFNPSEGFDAILGNPPWDTLQPNSKEFFSSFDPLYRGYGKQEAIIKQAEYFHRNAAIEQKWIEYNTYFKDFSNWVKYIGFPFGNRIIYDYNDRPRHDFNLGDKGKRNFDSSQKRHERWKARREENSWGADPEHAFRHQGTGKAYTYKMFIEQTYMLLSKQGRFGLIVPSGLYSDHGTKALRRLLLDYCCWEWLFGFENREKIFDIHRSFKFNPVIVAKEGKTHVLNTAFMRRNLADWEQAEKFSIEYPRQQILQFSPNSRTILEIQSQRDLEILTKIYSNSILLGDQSEKGWSIRYAQGDFNMTSDSKLFPPRSKWEEWGYRPDEYSRWIKGPWKPIEELFTELGVKAMGEGEFRCAQPPYDRLPIPRADIPAGIILSREADAWIWENEIPHVTFNDASGKPLKINMRNNDGEKVNVKVSGPAIALPLYQGLMFYGISPNIKKYVSGAGHSAVWEPVTNVDHITPQFLLSSCIYELYNQALRELKLGFRSLSNATNERTIVATIINNFPCGHSINLVNPEYSITRVFGAGIANSFVYDWQMRWRIVGTNITWNFLSESSWPEIPSIGSEQIVQIIKPLLICTQKDAPSWLFIYKNNNQNWKRSWARSNQLRLSYKCMLDAIVAYRYGINKEDLFWILKECDYPYKILNQKSNLEPKGFWRVDKDKHPEHRHTVLTLVAFHDLQEKISSYGGDVERGIEAFCNQNNGEGWMLPETLRLADYGLGHDNRAKEHQPVREYFGPRFYDWQLTQSIEESWRECHLHARNLLGKDGYCRLLNEIQGKEMTEQPERELGLVAESKGRYEQSNIFDFNE